MQFPETTQGLNRYTYVNNNPLSLTDPTGLFIGKLFKSIGNAFKSLFKAIGSLFKNPYVRLAIGIIAGAVGGHLIALQYAQTARAFEIIRGIAGGFIAGAIIGGTPESAFFGALAGGFAGTIGSYAKALGGWRPLAHGLTQGLTQRLQGGSFKSGLLSGAFTSWGQGLVKQITSGSEFLEFVGRSAASAVIGGTASVIGGGKFANGAQTGAFIYAFNELGAKAAEAANSAFLRVKVGKLLSIAADTQNGFSANFRPAEGYSVDTVDGVVTITQNGGVWRLGEDVLGSGFNILTSKPIGGIFTAAVNSDGTMTFTGEITVKGGLFSLGATRTIPFWDGVRTAPILGQGIRNIEYGHSRLMGCIETQLNGAPCQ